MRLGCGAAPRDTADESRTNKRVPVRVRTNKEVMVAVDHQRVGWDIDVDKIDALSVAVGGEDLAVKSASDVRPASRGVLRMDWDLGTGHGISV